MWRRGGNQRVPIKSGLCGAETAEAFQMGGLKSPPLQRLLVRGGNDADKASATALVFKFHVAGDEREQRVVLALPNVFAGLVLCAALANDNRARVDELAAESLYAKPLTV